MVFCQIDSKLIEILHKIADGRKFVDLGAGECLFEKKYTDKYPDEGVVSVELYPEHHGHFYIDRSKLVRITATLMPFDNNDLPIFIRPCHSIEFVPAALKNMEYQVPEAVYISNPDNIILDIPEEYEWRMIEGWKGKDDGERIFIIKLYGEKYVRKEVEWFMVKMAHWPEAVKMKKIFRNGECHYVNAKGGGFPCDSECTAEPIK